ncbi:MAG: CtsR family transcriptional regulator [Desulfotomaculales bacterium]
MRSIADDIERYLKALLAQNMGQVEVRRKDLAMRFKCVPSQINYVLATRFTVGHGFIVESRRGGGGYVRIMRVPLNRQSQIAIEVCRSLGSRAGPQEAEAVVRRLQEEGLVTYREARLMRAVLDREVLPREGEGEYRVRLLRAMVLALLGDLCGEG